ncbi:MAG: thioredoxin domain-containing protein, partial [Pseudomonas sp.]
PDLDDIYQTVVQMLGQGGGWPLTVFLTPQREPFFGGTYFPPQESYGRAGFPQLLHGLSEAWQNNRAALEQNVKQFLQGYRAMDTQMLQGDTPLEQDQPAAAARLFARSTDPVHGGLGNAPKFPNVACHDLVLRLYQRLHEPDLLRSVELTLDQMAAGGLYDHLGGGFARYCVDEHWAVPHFEKMLYDNGQLVKFYADAYRATGKPAWRRVFEETIDYTLRDMTHPEGGFYASEDADSEGEEGKYYVWTPAQVQAVLGDPDAALACRAYGVIATGNFEHGTTVLHRAATLDAAQEVQLAGLRGKLLVARAQRIRPGRDENILTSWNALMIQGLCAAYQATGTTTHLDAARRAADFILDRLSTPEGGLYRAWREDSAKVPGFLEDYAFLANALLDLYECDFDQRYLERATRLVELILEKFWEDGLYFTPSDGEPLVHRPRAPHDNAWPSGTSTSVFAFLRLFELTGRELYRERAEQVLAMYRAAAAQNPFGFAHLLAAQDFVQRGPISIVIVGERSTASALAASLQRRYLPARVLAFAEDVPIGVGRHTLKGQTTAYVCRNRTCEPPVTSAAELVECCLK